MSCISNIDTDMLIAITSVFAVIISIVSMISTFIFSRLQIKHNKNSVKPISSIQISDYEDRINVKVKNVGTGPLTIISLKCKNGIKEEDALIKMMPIINQAWSTFTECVDNWTIPVGGQLVLVELIPQSDHDKALVRRALSAITVSLDYTDIYGTRFHDERSLDFFGRHFF